MLYRKCPSCFNEFMPNVNICTICKEDIKLVKVYKIKYYKV